MGSTRNMLGGAWERAQRQARGSGAELDPARNPRRVYFRDGASEQQKSFAALGRAGHSELVEKHGDGSWTVQGKPPGAPQIALYVSPEQARKDREWIEREEPVEQAAGTALERHLIAVDMRGRDVVDARIFDQVNNRWLRLPRN